MGALALMAALWVLHPGFGTACKSASPAICLQGLWSKAPPDRKQDTEATPSAKYEDGLANLKAAMDKGDFKSALAWLDWLGQMAIRDYEAEEAAGALRRVRYRFVDLDLLARKLAAASDKAVPETGQAALRYSEAFASLATVESVDLVLRRAGLRAPKSLSGALLSAPLKAAVTEFWQDLAPTQVFFATNRARTDEETGVFGGELSEANEVQFGAGVVAVPVYVNEVAGADQLREVEDAPEQGTRQSAGVRTVKHLAPEQFSAMARERGTAPRVKDAMIYVPGGEASFENALIRAGELKRAMRIDGPVLLISQSPGAVCSGAETAKLMLTAWKRLSEVDATMKIHLIAHSDGACAAHTPFEKAGAAAKREVRAETMLFFDPHYQAGVHGPVYGHPEEPSGRKYFYDTESLVFPRYKVMEACPWSPGEKQRALWLEKEKFEFDGLVEVPPNPALKHWPVRGVDYFLPEVLNDVRGVIWLTARAESRCGICKVFDETGRTEEDAPSWRLYARRCGEPYELALELRRAHGKNAEAKLDTVLENLTSQERDLVRSHLKGLPVAP